MMGLLFRHSTHRLVRQPAKPLRRSQEGRHMSISRGVLVSLAVTVSIPSLAFAQATASITGVVRDPSGAVLPGVSVEAASPALIEQLRPAVTDYGGEDKRAQLLRRDYTGRSSL